MARLLISLLLFFINFAFAKGEITTVLTTSIPVSPSNQSSYYADKKYSFLSYGPYTHYYWGEGSNLRIDGFIYNGTEYKYVDMNASAQVKIRKSSTDYSCSIFAEVVDGTSHNDRRYKPSFPDINSSKFHICDLERIMSGRIINIGVLDLFNNKSAPSQKSIERVDFIYPSGITSPPSAYLEKAGHIVTEKSGNNHLKIAAILSLDSSGNPASYGPLITIYPNSKYYAKKQFANVPNGGADAIRYGITNIKLTQQFLYTNSRYVNSLGNIVGNPPRYVGHTTEPIGMAFVDLKTLGVPPNTTYYGFSYFGGDVTDGGNPNNLVDYTNPTYFPQDTKRTLDEGDADPYGGTAAYFVCDSCPTPSPTANISGFVFNDSNKNQIKDSTEGDIGATTYVKLCQNGSFISSIQTTGSFSFSVSNGKYTLIEDASNTHDCTTSGDPTGWSSSTSNFITVYVDGKNVTNQNFGNFYDNMYPISCNAGDAFIYADSNGSTDLSSLSTYAGDHNNGSPNHYLYRLNLSNGNLTTLANPIGGDYSRLNAMGYNPKDNFQWGSTYNTNKEALIYRVGRAGSSMGPIQSTQFGPIEGLTIDSNAGAIDKDGQLHLFRYMMDEFSFMEIVDLDPKSPTYLKMTGRFELKKPDGTPTIGLKPTDFDFHPIDGMIYTISNNGHYKTADVNRSRLYRINPNTGLTEDLGAIEPLRAYAISSMFFTSDGTFYFVDSGMNNQASLAALSSNLYKLDLTNPSSPNLNATFIATISNKFEFGDGTVCPGVITQQDFGDAAIGYDTTANHTMPSNNIYLGYAIDSETSASLDADNGEDDGVFYQGSNLHDSIINIDSSSPSTINLDITVSGNGYLSAWVDWNGDKNFETTPDEKIIDNIYLTSGTSTIPITIPALTSYPNQTYARFRFSSDTNLNSTGTATDGEVEDYRIDLNGTTGNTFDAWDVTQNITNKIIDTKIVGTPFNITIGSVDSATKSTFVTNTNSNIQVYIESFDPPFATTPKPLNMTNLQQANISLSSNFASKRAYIMISYTDSSGNPKVAQSTDAFAIRPDRFHIILNPPSPIKAGSEFNMTIEALSSSGSLVTNYDNNPSSYKIDYSTPSKPGCQGTFTNLINQAFVNGVAKINNIKYHGIDELNITVSELNPYASIDSSYSLITPATVIPTFNKAKFYIEWDHTNAFILPDHNLTLYAPLASLDDMSSNLTMKLIVKDENNSTVVNFDKNCFAKDTIIKVTFNTDTNSNSMNIKSNIGGSQSILLPNTSFTYTIFDNNFSSGIANDTIRLNFNKELSIPLNPADLNITLVEANSSLVPSSIQTPTNKEAKFYHIRAHAPNYYTTNSPFDATVYYEVYCKNCNTANFPLAKGDESKDSVYWYILKPSIYNHFTPPPFNAISSNNSIVTIDIANSNDLDNIRLEASSIPTKTRVSFDTHPWLRFISLRPSFYVDFNAAARQWVGKGDIGRGVDLNISTQKTNKMQW